MNESLHKQEGPTYSVVPAEEDDAEEIQKLVYNTWLSTYPNEKVGITIDDIEERYKNRLTPEGVERYKNNVLAKSDTQKSFKAKVNGRIVGVCVVNKTETENNLIALYVDPNHQGKGVGKMLWQEAQTFFDTDKDIIVELATYNEKALAFYNSIGFLDTGKRMKDEKLKMKSGTIVPTMELKIPKKS